MVRCKQCGKEGFKNAHGLAVHKVTCGKKNKKKKSPTTPSLQQGDGCLTRVPVVGGGNDFWLECKLSVGGSRIIPA